MRSRVICSSRGPGPGNPGLPVGGAVVLLNPVRSAAPHGHRLTSLGDRVGITPKSWTAELRHGVLHLGKRWYVVSAEVDADGHAEGVRLDGPYPDHASAEEQARRIAEGVTE